MNLAYPVACQNGAPSIARHGKGLAANAEQCSALQRERPFGKQPGRHEMNQV